MQAVSINTHTQTHTFNGPLSGTTRVSRYQKGEWQWNQLGRMQVCTSLQTDNHASTPLLSFFTDRMPFLPPNQQRQSTEGKAVSIKHCDNLIDWSLTGGLLYLVQRRVEWRGRIGHIASSLLQ